MTFKQLLLTVGLTYSLLGHGQQTVSSRVSTFTIEAPQLQSDKKIWIYLPKKYSENSKHYPTVYMHDAQNLFDAETSFAGEWQIDEHLDSIADDTSIIIGIEHGNEKRMDELTPYANEKYGGGNADTYLGFIINTLKPYIDSTYRTQPDSKNTTIFGSSLGGLLSFYAVIKHPEVFGNAGVFSPSFWFNHNIYDAVSKSNIPATSRFYFLAGSEESDTMITELDKMVALLMQKGVTKSHFMKITIQGGQHNETLWRENFPDAYKWLTRK